MSPNVTVCRLCGSTALRTVYAGPIRAGGAESGQVDGFTILHCSNCGVEFLDPFPQDTDAYYSGKQYWEDHHGPVDVAKLQAKHGPEQRRWFSEVGASSLQGKRLADFGSGIGLFLDQAKDVAVETIGVDLAEHFREHVQANGHRFVLRPQELAAGSADVIVSFDTLEHVPQPAEFMVEAYRVLTDGGSLYIGVPNQADFLKHFVPEYLPFFYHLSHLWYFSEQALRRVLSEAGFKNMKVSYVHKYDLINLIVWVRDRKGIGTPGSELFDRHAEESFRSNLERQGIASHILIKAEK
jgi:2-polyprenyl-3-methyl-5-hydroxy-6-metoxy-1,4-benzoquinol methylase